MRKGDFPGPPFSNLALPTSQRPPACHPEPFGVAQDKLREGSKVPGRMTRRPWLYGSCPPRADGLMRSYWPRILDSSVATLLQNDIGSFEIDSKSLAVPTILDLWVMLSSTKGGARKVSLSQRGVGGIWSIRLRVCEQFTLCTSLRLSPEPRRRCL